MRKRRAVALRWDPRLPAPYVLASGKGRAAERLERLARDAGVPVVENAVAAEALEPLASGELVPVEYWEIVAGVLALVARLEKR